MMRVRLGKEADCREMSKVFYQCSREQPGSFLYKLGRLFLQEYLRTTLRSANSVVLCALDDSGRIVGFVSGSLDATAHWKGLRKSQVRMVLAALPAILRRPRLIAEIMKRYRFVFGPRAKHTHLLWTGARCGYWGMLPSARGGLGAVILFRKWLEVMRLLGAKDIILEVDQENATSEETHRRLGAKVAVEFVAPGHTLRSIMVYRAPTSEGSS